MVRPASFGYNEETAANNVFQTSMQALTQQEIQEKAIKEFDDFVISITKK